MSAFLLNLITTYLYSGAASTRAILTERRDYMDGGGSVAVATFA